MTGVDLCKRQAGEAFGDFLDAIDGLETAQAWARTECLPNEYLHTEGSILSIVCHVAACKQVYGSLAYGAETIRWRDTVERLEAIWPSWESAREWLKDAHRFWVASWQHETDLERMVPRFDGQLWPSWKIISTVTQHDCYHAGQIQLLRATVSPTNTPPPEEGELWRKYCQPLPSW